MKKSTKILLIIFIVTLLPGIIFGKSIINGISVVENKFAFNFDLGAIVGLVFIGINIILGMILFFRFLASLPLDKVLFFSTVPLVLIYGILFCDYGIKDLYKIPFVPQFPKKIKIL